MIKDISNIPSMPGVYIFKGQKERILYVGKAKNLRNRIRSYFQDSANLEPRKIAMLKMIKDISYIATDNELEALILEANLIKQYKPRFNIILRDDKNYPYLKLTIKEDWPRIMVVRRIEKDGNIYFGPYVPSQSMWEALAFIRRNFSIRTCGYALDKPMRPCIQYQMKKCPAPCAGLISKEDYMKMIDDIRLFLSGEKKELLQRLEEKMQSLSEEMRFEEAAKIRDRIFKLQRAFESQKVVSPELGDIDVIGHYKEFDNHSFHVLFVRNGILIGAKDFYLEKVIESDEAAIMYSFIETFYSKEIIPPDKVITNIIPSDIDSLTGWLKKRKGTDIKIKVPEEDKEYALLRMANENARLHYISRKKTSIDFLINDIKKKLNLSNVPNTIGAFDVSTIHGSDSVGAFIFWERGDFKKEYYRRLKIKGISGIDDYAMMREIVERILLKAEEVRKEPDLAKKIPIPDLLIIDGGKGQLEVANRVMKDLGIKTDIIGIAKKPDRVFLTNNQVIDIEDKSSSSLLLRSLRDEVHRFAITFHRKLRDKRLTESVLEKIPNIGKKRRLELLRHFGSIDNIRRASAEEIAKIKGFNMKLANSIIEKLKTNG